jgi:heat shock protein HslJ
MYRNYLIPLTALALTACQTMPDEPPAEAANIGYRALGTEPFWSLTIDGKNMIFSQAGKDDIFGDDTVSRPSFNGWRHVSKAITADITFTPCSDGMSDKTYKDTVTIMVGKRTYKGCGGGVAIPKSLEQTQWRIESINGKVLPPEREAILSFADDRMSATIGCNRLGASYMFKGKSLSFGPVMSTKMGCPDAIAAQELTLSQLLGAMKSTEFLSDGAIILTGQDGSSVILEQSI